MAFTFKGGLRIPSRKITAKNPITQLNGTNFHYFPINQHRGSPLMPIVKEGDYVRAGQKLADTEELTSTPVHSSVSGTVKEITDEQIVIENDYKYETTDTIKPIVGIDGLTTREKLWVIRDAGIIGMDGVPAHINLHSSKQMEYLIINGAESEPYLTARHRLMLENAEAVADGIEIMVKLLGVKKAYIGIETNKRNAFDRLRQVLRYNERIEVIKLKPKYPQGSARPLIKAILGKNVPIGQKPCDMGIVVENIETAYNVHRAFRRGMPVIDRIVTVSGNAVVNPGNFRVLTGVPISYLIEKSGGYKEAPQRLVTGGLISGTEHISEDVPVAKNTTAVLALTKARKVKDKPCRVCRKCIRVCPVRLNPEKLYKAAVKGDISLAQRYNISECAECGLCSYVCPSGRNISAFKAECEKQERI